MSAQEQPEQPNQTLGPPVPTPQVGADDRAEVGAVVGGDLVTLAHALHISDAGDSQGPEEALPPPPPPRVPYSLMHDRYDQRVFAEIQDQNADFATYLAEVGEPWPYPLPLAMDLFTSLYHSLPEPQPVERFDPTYTLNKVAVAAVMETTAYQDLRDRSVMDEFTAAVGVPILVQEVLDNVEMAQAAAQVAAAQQQTGAGAPTQGEGESDAAFAQRQQEYKQQQRAQREGQRRLDAAARSAASRAREAMEDAQDTLDVLAHTWGGAQQDFLYTANAREKARLVKKVQENPKLREIIRFAGRFRRVAASAQKLRTVYSPTEVTDITTGNDLGRLLPSELAQLVIPETADLFMQRYLTHSLLQYELAEPVREGQGPIVVAEDESGSMAGLPDSWAKAAFLTLYGVAQEQKRDVYFMHFSDTQQLKVEVFRFGQQTVERKTGYTRGVLTQSEIVPLSPDALLDTVLFFFNGGTDYEPWIAQALTAVEESEWRLADVVLLSDGDAHVEEATVARWAAAKTTKGFRSYGILIQRSASPGRLEDICDTWAVLNPGQVGDGHADQGVLEELFSL